MYKFIFWSKKLFRKILKKNIKNFLKIFLLDIIAFTKYPSDFSLNNINIYESVKNCTMSGPHRVNALIDAVNYLENNCIAGSIVECGVWRGGSIMAAAITLKKREKIERDFYLYDTFTGMTKPSNLDIGYNGESAKKIFSQTKTSKDTSDWCFSSLTEVRKNVFSTGYPKNKFHFIKGKVEDTIPKKVPKEIALLRIDTDWYASTKHELVHLFPLLKKDGILIIDDYGDWKGARKAVDEYITEKNIKILLNRVSGSRIAVKQ